MIILTRAIVALFLAAMASVAVARPVSHIEPRLPQVLDTAGLTATIQPPYLIQDEIPLACAPVELTGDSGHLRIDELEILNPPEDNLICWWTADITYLIWRGGW